MTFESSAPDVATVDEDGVVYGVSEGSATITATSYNGLTAVCTVTVQGGNSSRLKLPAFLKEIGEEAFAGCSEESVIVPDGCETIGARAFADSANLRTITIPASVTSIAADAFDGCTDLTIRAPRAATPAGTPRRTASGAWRNKFFLIKIAAFILSALLGGRARLSLR